MLWTDFLPSAQLCSVSSTTLAGVDSVSINRTDYSYNPPKSSGKIVLQKQLVRHMCVAQMCVAQDGQLLVILLATGEERAVSAYNAKTVDLVWEKEIKLPGMKIPFYSNTMASDGRHLYVADAGNRCVQMFRASDGDYLGTLMREEGQNLGVPCAVKWYKSSLFVAHYHEEDDKWGISKNNVVRKH